MQWPTNPQVVQKITLLAILILSKGQRTIHLERCCRNAVLFLLIRDTTLSSLAFECGRIRTVWPRHLSYQIYGYHSLASMMTDIPRSHPSENWMMISHHFPHLQTLFGLHPRLSWEKRGANSIRQHARTMKLLRPLAVSMDEDTSRKVQQLITVLHNEHHINEMTEK